MDITKLINKSSKEDFEPATGWLNLGVYESPEQFISIGGIAIESIKPMKGSSEFAATQRSLVAAIIKKFEGLPEGSSTLINLKVELRKVGKEIATNSDMEWDL